MAQNIVQSFGDGGTWFAETLAKGLCAAVEAMTGRPVDVQWLATEGGATGGRAAPPSEWWEQPLTAGKGSRIWVCAPEASWQSVGALALAAAGIDDATPEDCNGTWREIQAQGISSAAQELSRRIRKDVSCEAGKVVSPPSDSGFSVDIILKVPDEVWFRCGWNDALQSVLQPEPERPAPPPATNSAIGSGPENSSAKALPASVQNSRTLDLLLEVELPISVSFGRVQLPLKDVLKLNSGSIVELNRSISEPVEIIVNNCVIARGEVVVVEGNYGVRIKQIISKEERLRTLY
ncbi:MAG: flagellar motor switch protein FliN [Acidobacteria bacterium]|nr:flagellar motor switch protein FliN [Acidobacteriota bacterium]